MDLSEEIMRRNGVEVENMASSGCSSHSGTTFVTTAR
jgi:hypothetical protein